MKAWVDMSTGAQEGDAFEISINRLQVDAQGVQRIVPNTSFALLLNRTSVLFEARIPVI